MRKDIVLLPGTGIGPEITAQAERILRQVAAAYRHEFSLSSYPIAEAGASPLAEKVLEACLKSDAVLTGAAGGPDRPDQGLRDVRRAMGLFANVRPFIRRPESGGSRSGGPVDLLIVREIFDGVCFDRHGRPRSGSARGGPAPREAVPREEARRIARLAFRLARGRRRTVVGVEAAGIPELSPAWETALAETAAEHPDVAYRSMKADEAAVRIARVPGEFDIVITPNRFGDILSEMAGMAAGSPHLVASASLGESARGLFEPVQRSAPNLAGRNAANPLPAILCAALMLRYSFGLEAEAEAVERAVAAVRASSYRTEEEMASGRTRIGTEGMGRLIAEAVRGR